MKTVEIISVSWFEDAPGKHQIHPRSVHSQYKSISALAGSGDNDAPPSLVAYLNIDRARTTCMSPIKYHRERN